MCPVLRDPVALPWTNFYPPGYEGTFTSHGALSADPNLINNGVLDTNVAFEIDIF